MHIKWSGFLYKHEHVPLYIRSLRRSCWISGHWLSAILTISLLLGSERKRPLRQPGIRSQPDTEFTLHLMVINVKPLRKDITQCEVNKKETEDRMSFLFRAVLISILNKLWRSARDLEAGNEWFFLFKRAPVCFIKPSLMYNVRNPKQWPVCKSKPTQKRHWFSVSLIYVL